MLHYNVTFMDRNEAVIEMVPFEADDLADLCDWIANYIRGDSKAFLVKMELVDEIPALDQAA